MAQETYAAVLRLVEPDVNKEFSISFHLPNANRPTTIVWNQKNNFEAEVPTKITYIDDHKKTKVFQTNYAKEILDAYGIKGKGKIKVLEFVKECKRDEFEQKMFPDQEVENVTKPKENKKEQKHEK